MRQNAKEKYWREVEARNYVQVMDADPELVIKLFDLARGDMSMEKFLHACRLSASRISNLVYGGTKHIHVKDIFLVMQYLPKGSPVTEDLLLAANGLYKKTEVPAAFSEMEKSIKKLRKKIRSLKEPARKTKMAKREKQEKEPRQKAIKKTIVPEPFTGYDSYDAFIDDLSFYGRRQPEPVLFFLKENQGQLFADNYFCRALSLYRKYATAERERRVTDLQAFYASGTDMPGGVSASGRYKLILDIFVNQRRAKP